MNKPLTLVALFLLIVISSYSQTLVSESFEGDVFPPDGWATIPESGTYSWTQVNSGFNPTCIPHSGNLMAGGVSNNWGLAHSFGLVSPVFNLSALGDKIAYVSFRFARAKQVLYDVGNLCVHINTTPSIVNATKLGEVKLYTTSNYTSDDAEANWYLCTFKIPANFTGEENYALFEATTEYGSNVYIDDVNIRVIDTNDAGIQRISTTGEIPTVGNQVVKAKIINYGVDLSSVVVNWSVNDVEQTPYTAAFNTLPSGAVSEDIAIGNYNFTEGGNYTVKVWTSLPNGMSDANSSNDLLTKTFLIREVASLPYTQDFESTWFNGASISDMPDKYMVNIPATGDASYRRDDDGANTWTYSTLGMYSSAGAKGTSHSARRHSTQASWNNSVFEFYINTQLPGKKKLVFYSNESSKASFYRNISVSYDEGNSFSYLNLGSLIKGEDWNRNEFVIEPSSDKCLIRIETNGVNESEDLGLDEVSVIEASDVDCGITGIYEPSVGFISGNNYEITGYLKNFGKSDLTGATINWSVNDEVQDPFIFSGYIPASNDDVYNLPIGTFLFPSEGTYIIKAWTTNPNGTVDGDPENDLFSISVNVNAAASLPYVQSFDNTWESKLGTRDVPDLHWRNVFAVHSGSWRRDDDGASGTWIDPSMGLYTPSGANNTDHSARIHTSIGVGTSSLMLFVDMAPVGNKLLSFSYINTDGNDTMVIDISSDGGETFTSLKTLTTASEWTNYSVSLGEATSKKTIVRFRTEDSWNNSNSDIGIDQVAINVISNDAKVSAFTSPTSTYSNPSLQKFAVRVRNNGANSLFNTQIVWSVNDVVQSTINQLFGSGLVSGEESSVITLGDYNFAIPGDYTIKAWTNLPNGLMDGASDNDTITLNFKTLGLPYSENFDNVILPAIPAYYSVSNTNSDYVNWENNNRYKAHSGTNQLSLQKNWSDNTQAMDDWIYTPAFQYVQGKNYKLSFWYRCTGYYTFDGKLEVKLGPSTSTMTTQLYFNDNIVWLDYQKVTVTFSTETTGNYYVGFHAFSGVNCYYTLIDDITIEEVLATDVDQPTSTDKNAILLYPNPVMDVLNVKSDIAFKTISIYNSLGRMVWSGDSSLLPINTSELVAGVYVIVFENDTTKEVRKFIKR